MAFTEIFSGGPPEDGIPSIYNPKFQSVKDVDDLLDTVPEIDFPHEWWRQSVSARHLMRHQIFNNRVGGVPVVVT